LLEPVRVLVARWRPFLGVPLVAVSVTLIVSIFLLPTYTASTTFVPEAPPPNRLPSGLAGLAGQFGIGLGTSASQSPRFYAQLVTSRELLESVLNTRFPDPRASAGGSDSVPLLELLATGGRDSADRIQRAARELSRCVSVSVDNQTSVVHLDVDARYPGLAANVANAFVAYLNDFNTRTRQSQARERRKFVEQRVGDAQRDLRAAEDHLRAFLERNRSWQQAPQLVFEEGRLRRQLDVNQEVYLTLKRDYETARIEEVNDTPVITVIDPAVAPRRKSRPHHMMMGVLALVLGVLGGAALAFISEYLDTARKSGDATYREVAQAFVDAKGDLHSAFRRTFARRAD